MEGATAAASYLFNPFEFVMLLVKMNGPVSQLYYLFGPFKVVMLLKMNGPVRPPVRPSVGPTSSLDTYINLHTIRTHFKYIIYMCVYTFT